MKFTKKLLKRTKNDNITPFSRKKQVLRNRTLLKNNKNLNNDVGS